MELLMHVEKIVPNMLLLKRHLKSNGRADLNPLDTKNHS
jgi:hypothetical protein